MEQFVMPRVSLSDDEEMVVSRWIVDVGTTVTEGQPILEVETAKANMEVEAPCSGVLASVLVMDGDAVSPGDTLAIILGPGEELDSTPEPATASPTPAPASSSRSGGSTPADVTRRPSVPAGDGPTQRRLETAPFEHPGALYGIPSTHRSPRPAPPASATAGPRAVAPRAAPRGATAVPLTKHRIAVGNLMLESWRIPQFAVRRDVQMDQAERTLQALRAAGVRATLTDVLLRAVARALVARPEVNRLFVGDELFQMPRPVVALAADSPAGVVAPVLHGLDTATWSQVVAERDRVVRGAREGRLMPRDLNGGSFSVSNVGPLGGDAVTPLVVAPQVGILGVGAVRSTDAGHVASLQFVGDHRALDGADGARFLASLAELLDAAFDPAELGEAL